MPLASLRSRNALCLALASMCIGLRPGLSFARGSAGGLKRGRPGPRLGAVGSGRAWTRGRPGPRLSGACGLTEGAMAVGIRILKNLVLSGPGEKRLAPRSRPGLSARGQGPPGAMPRWCEPWRRAHRKARLDLQRHPRWLLQCAPALLLYRSSRSLARCCSAIRQ